MTLGYLRYMRVLLCTKRVRAQVGGSLDEDTVMAIITQLVYRGLDREIVIP